MKPLAKQLSTQKLSNPFTQMEMLMVPLLSEMEFFGIPVDESYFSTLQPRIADRLNELEEFGELFLGGLVNLFFLGVPNPRIRYVGRFD